MHVMSSVEIITPRRFADTRGWFAETYSEADFDRFGIGCRFVQDNHSHSSAIYTLRGLHFQFPPHAQAKLVRCVRGRVFDVAVDIRQESSSYGKWTGAELTAERGEQIFVPEGFAHGFLTLEADCEVIYKCSHIYVPASEGGLAWDDPDIAIDWPLPAGETPVLSGKDRDHPRLASIDSPFMFEPQALQKALVGEAR